MPDETKEGWRGWARVRRFVPLVTIVVAIGVGIATAVGAASNALAQGAIISMLGLIALDALIERVGIIERIERQLSKLDVPPLLRDRTELIPIEHLADEGSEVVACGVTLVSLISNHFDYLNTQLGHGTKFRFILLDPASQAWKTWHETQRVATPEDTEIALRTLEPLIRGDGLLQVRLSPYHLPVSLMIVNGSKSSGRMNVELAFTAVSLLNRPHMHFSRSGSPKWFAFFFDQFESLWSKSKPWTPDSAARTPGATVPTQ